MVHKNYLLSNFDNKNNQFLDKSFVKDYIAMCKKGIENVTLDSKVHE